MNNNNTFNLHRFALTLKWTLLTEKKSIITAATAFTAVFLIVQLYSCFTIFDLTLSQGRMAAGIAITSCTGLLGIMCGYYATGLLGHARTGQQRTTALMMPASNAEKFTARIVYCCVLMPLLMLAALWAAIGLRMLLELVFGHQGIVTGYMNLSPHLGSSSLLMSWAGELWVVSLFVLGGVLFRQHPFVWTVVTLLVGTVAFTTLTFYAAKLMGEGNVKQFLTFLSGMSFQTFDLIVSLVLAAFTVVNLWFSYRLFCRLQVVQHKWFNV